MNNSKHQAIVHFNNGGKLFKSNLYNDALEQYQKAFESDPTFYDVHFSIARTLISLDRQKEGINHFAKYAKLIPKGKQGRYTLGLSKILYDQKFYEEALSLVESLDVNFTEEQAFEFVQLLLGNNRYAQAIHQLLNLNDRSKLNKKYEALLENTELPSVIIEKLDSERLIPRFFEGALKLEALKTAKTQDKNYHSKLAEIESRQQDIKEGDNSDYIDQLRDVDHRIFDAQEILAKQADLAIKKKNISIAREAIAILKESGFDKEKRASLQSGLSKIEKARNNKTLRIGAIALISILVLSTAWNYGYSHYKNSKAYDLAISSGTIDGYSQYLSNYGDNDEIHILREQKLYDKALLSNNGNDINSLVNLYPKSKFLASIKVSSTSANTQLYVYGIGYMDSPIDIKNNNGFKVPLGCKVVFRINAHNKVTLQKAFTVFKDLNLTEELVESKTVIFEDDFENNKNAWTTSNSSKVVYGRTKSKGAQVRNSGLELYHEFNDNGFVSSSIYLPRLERSDDFEIVADIKRNGYDKGTFILFGGTKRAFNYFAFAGNGTALFGYNNWDKSSEKWIKQSRGWERHSNINRGNQASNQVTITKRGKNVTYNINNNFISQVPLKKWYGRRIGFGVNDNTNSNILNLEISVFNRSPKTIFELDHVYFCWVDELNVRAEGSTKGEILTTISQGDPVKYIGEVGEKEVRATFREIFSPDYYYKVELLDGTVGWVHGGALKGLNASETVNFSEFESLPKTSTINRPKPPNSSEFYMISVYAEKDKSLIQKRVKEIENKGFTSDFLWIPDYQSLSGAKMYSAYIGPFSTKEECRIILQNVRREYPKAYGLLASKKDSSRVTIK